MSTDFSEIEKAHILRALKCYYEHDWCSDCEGIKRKLKDGMTERAWAGLDHATSSECIDPEDEPDPWWWLDHIVPDPGEWHSFILGFTGAQCEDMPDSCREIVEREWWYYQSGKKAERCISHGLKLSMGILAAYAVWRLFR